MGKQQEFKGSDFKKPGDCFGGSLLKNSHAKTKRPVESKLPLHLVLRANRGLFRLPKFYNAVNSTVWEVCRKHGVRLYEYANVGNHLHLVIKIPRHEAWAAFIRELTGRLPLLLRAKGGLWKQRPFTRIVRGWKKAFKIAKEYVELNRLEAEGFINRKETKTLKDLRAIFADW